MSGTLYDLSTSTLATAIKANLFDWYRYLGSSPNVELDETPERTWVLTGLPTAKLNVVLRTQAEAGSVDTTIEDTLAYFRSKNLAQVSWWVEPDTRPEDMGRHLAAHGLTYAEGIPGMAVDLSVLNENPRTPSGLTIEPVRDIEALKQWAHVSRVGFGFAETCEDTWRDMFTGLGFELPLRNYVGILNGEPVATSELFLGQGVAGIYIVATLPEARRQGIGAAMTLTALREARALGYRIGILHASSMGQGVYRQLGFQEHCRMSFHVWTNETIDLI